jgi:hypothetical protein
MRYFHIRWGYKVLQWLSIAADHIIKNDNKNNPYLRIPDPFGIIFIP